MRAESLKPAVKAWVERLENEEKAENTIKQYSRSLDRFTKFVESNDLSVVDKKCVLSYKDALLREMRNNLNNPRPGRVQIKSVSTINSQLIALNKFLKESGEPDLTAKLLRDATSNTLDDMLTESEYKRIIKWADKLGKEKIKLVIETLTGTGIRISELEAITVESLKRRTAIVTNKGKTRTIFIPKRLAGKLKVYCQKNGISQGIVFHARNDTTKLLSQSFIRREMKKIAGKARGIKRDKVHAHAFRHLFAKRYANMPGANPFILPMLLGHSSNAQNTTVLYTKPTTKELLKAIDDMETYYTTVDLNIRREKGK